MSAEDNESWPQPVTFAGVAQFARARSSVLAGYQFVVAALAAAIAIFFLEHAWVPVLERAISRLPPTGAIENGRLDWPAPGPVQAAGSTFLWISIDPNNSLEPGEGADLQLELGRTEARLRSLFGYVAIPYPPAYRIAVNRSELEPWWGAWHLPLKVGIGLGTIVMLFIVWTLLAMVYAWPVRLIGFYADRQLTWAGAWRIGAACLLPGALFMEGALLAYTFHRLNLLQLLGAMLLHFMIGWVYLLFAPFSLPRVEPGDGKKPNPFSSSAEPAKGSENNPFRVGQ